MSSEPSVKDWFLGVVKYTLTVLLMSAGALGVVAVALMYSSELLELVEMAKQWVPLKPPS
jgi:hypothetical protein